jgi:NAD(P)-dependent dehydrogenase (short-subunit alcohol dehydrogenase family)
MTGPLEGRRILVTGASRGIGRHVALRLARDGAEVVVVSRDLQTLRGVLAELEPGPHAAVALDVRDRSAWSDAMDAIAPGGRLSGVVTAAATLKPIGPIGTWDIEEFRQTLDTNIVGTVLAVECAVEYLKSSSGSIVAFSGGGATGAFPRYDAYAASKAAVVRLVENLAIELRPDSVRVNCVAPGFIVTDMHLATIAAGPEQVGRDYFDRTRRAVENDDGDSPDLAAALVSFLVSPASEPISGKLISARWDPWQDEEFQRRLANDPDFATLRRIDGQFFVKVPETRD